MKNCWKQNSVKPLKYSPILASFGWVLYITARIHGWNMSVIEIIEVCLGFYIVWAFSHYLHFCIVHKAMIYYSYLCTVCYFFDREIGFGKYNLMVLVITLALGIILFVWLGINYYRNRCNTDNTDDTNE